MAAASRRSFLKAVNLALGGAITALLAVPGIRFLIFPAWPARRKVVDSSNDFVPVASASAVGAKPLRVEITVAERRDAWSRMENVRLGAAWLVRDEAGGVRALTTTCPHLGCPVDFDAAANSFRCPCHTSTFTLNGERVSGPAKRGMDPLPARVDEHGRVLVRFLRFKPDKPEREEA